MLDVPVLGIDIGSVSVACALVEPGRGARGARTACAAHKGRTRETLLEAAAGLRLPTRVAIALTSGSPDLVPGALRVDPHTALVAGCRGTVAEVGSILYVGAEHFGLVRLDEQGGYRGARTNSSCAAGTGSFLDQQARRLGLSGIEELAAKALASTLPTPRISTRCAVFARTDLVHAQQAGCSIEEICDGLCHGLARTIADTLLGGEAPREPVIFAGGVALNEAVRRHLESLVGVAIVSHPGAPVLGALGAALVAAAGEAARAQDQPLLFDLRDGLDVLLAERRAGREYFYPALDLDAHVPADSPGDGEARAGELHAVYAAGARSRVHPVEVDVYRATRPGPLAVRMGIDIGSTSTKAILLDDARRPVAGFYTRTLGAPLAAAQALCEAIEDFQARQGLSLLFSGVAATGAGRRFVGAIIRADLVVDEITAHARAAYELDPGIDTIIEIGGQDAKFTTMRDGMVTFSHMNTVCAAGTGSFLEEQAARLGVDLADYQERVRGARAPLASDRCAVFMERDINTFIAQGFSTEEILAAALYSVRENYLQKVARGAAMGDRICFQGATARNRALVAAFAQGLGRPVFVSRWCHLTGALGAALLQGEQATGSPSRFRGLASLRGEIPVRAETCDLCANHCRISVAVVGGETVAYGFLCGRDYGTAHFVSRNRSGFDLAAERRRAFGTAGSPARLPGRDTPAAPAGVPVIGIPAALALLETLPMWKQFFASLGIPFVTSEGLADAVARGRNAAGAEFCAPIAALHGHVAHLADRADLLFLPFFLEESEPDSRAHRMYCQYTQYSSALASGIDGGRIRGRCLMPLVSYSKWKDRTRRELYEVLEGAGVPRLSPALVARQFDRALARHVAGVRRLQRRFREEMAGPGDVRVLLIGRPYTALSPDMSKGIPEIFGALGVKAFFQDMVPYRREDVAEIAPLLEAVHWKFAAKNLEAALVAARTPNLYPVFVTSFKCSPDSFALEYFRRILDGHAKPYLVLQLDDHDSSVGYETRIEAGVASFRNHARRAAQGRGTAARRIPAAAPGRAALPVNPRTTRTLAGKTLLFPNWDPLLNPLAAAVLRREGIDTRVLHEDALLIRSAMRHNTGQCIPLNIIAEEAVHYVRAHGLDPARTALWLPRSGWSCNIAMLPPFLKTLFESFGGGMEHIEVYSGELALQEVSLRASLNAFRAAMVGGLLRRVGCRLRPYETVPGATDAALAGAMDILVPAFEGRTARDTALREAAALFDAVPVERRERPTVAIFGDLYVRDNDVMSQDLVRAIERAGGEVIATPSTEYFRIVMGTNFRRLIDLGDWTGWLGLKVTWTAGEAMASRCRSYFERFLEPDAPVEPGALDWMRRNFGVRGEHAGESADNLQKVYHLARAHPDLRLFVQASPAFCCPSLITEAMARAIERLTGVPVVSVTYDGTGTYRNGIFEPWLRDAVRTAPAPSRSS